MEVLLLRFDAPLMSFGGVCVDAHGTTQPLPGRSMLTGLCGNALGLRHGEADALQALQSRIIYAARVDRVGQTIVDYQTTDLGQRDRQEREFMQDANWTTDGQVEARGGGTAKKGTDIRFRHYIADGCVTVAMAIETGEGPSLDQVAAALQRPARPLFIGRKCCIPASPVYLGRRSASSVREAVEEAPLAPGGAEPPHLAWWPLSDGLNPSRERKIGLVDDRDWRNQIHAGRRWMVEGYVRQEEMR